MPTEEQNEKYTRYQNAAGVAMYKIESMTEIDSNQVCQSDGVLFSYCLF